MPDNIRVEFRAEAGVNKVWVRFDDPERQSKFVWRFIMEGFNLLLDAYFVHKREGSGWKEIKSYSREQGGCPVNDVMLPKEVLLEAIMVDLADQIKIVTQPDKPGAAVVAAPVVRQKQS